MATRFDKHLRMFGPTQHILTQVMSIPEQFISAIVFGEYIKISDLKYFEFTTACRCDFKSCNCVLVENQTLNRYNY